MLPQRQETPPSDPAIGNAFNACRLADCKEPAADLLKRLASVGAKAVECVDTERKLKRG